MCRPFTRPRPLALFTRPPAALHTRSPPGALSAPALSTAPRVFTLQLSLLTRKLLWPNFSRALHYPVKPGAGEGKEMAPERPISKDHVGLGVVQFSPAHLPDELIHVPDRASLLLSGRGGAESALQPASVAH